jgi:hypothetical protein
MQPKHSKITSYSEPDKDGVISATTNSYFDELASRKEWVIVNIKTTRDTVLSDVISCMDVINKQQTKELIIRITADDWNQPSLIVKEYVVRKENFKRR